MSTLYAGNFRQSMDKRLIISILSFIYMVAVCACSGGDAPGVASGDDSAIRDQVQAGYQFIKNKEPKKALLYYKKAAASVSAVPTSSELKDYAKALTNIGYIYLFFYNNPEKAYPYLLRGKKLAQENGFHDILGGAYDNMAKIYDDFGDAEKALDTYSLALQHAVSDSTDISPWIQLMIFNDMVACAMANDMPSRIADDLKTFDTLPVYDIPMGRYSKQLCRALQKTLEGKPGEGTDILRSATELIDSRIDIDRYRVDHFLTLGNLYHVMQLEDSAEVCVDTAMSIALKHNIADKLPRIYNAKSVIDKAQGDSYHHSLWKLKSYSTGDSLYKTNTYGKIISLEPILDIDVLQQRMKVEELKHHNRITLIWILTGAFIIIALLLVYIFSRNIKLKASYQNLAARHRESVRQSEANNRLQREYEATIDSLKAKLHEAESNAGCSGQSEAEDEAAPSARVTLAIADEERLRIMGAVNEIMSTSEEICSSDFSLERLAELTKTKPRYLSAIINDTAGKSFSQMLAEVRISKACSMLLSPDFRKSLTLEGVAQAIGYRSRTHFTSIFKKITGLTPTQYILASR